MKAVIAAFNQEKALVGAFSVVQPVVGPMDRFTALARTREPLGCKICVMLVVAGGAAVV